MSTTGLGVNCGQAARPLARQGMHRTLQVRRSSDKSTRSQANCNQLMRRCHGRSVSSSSMVSKDVGRYIPGTEAVCAAPTFHPMQGEAATVAGFRADPYGCSGKLKAKKAQRDPFAVGPIHPSRCPDMASLLGYCGRNTFPGPLPWDPSGRRQAATSKLKQGRVAEDGMR